MITESDIYEYTPLVYRALNIRANALARMPFRLIDHGVEKVWRDVFATPLKGLLRLTESSLLLTGSAYWLAIDQGGRRMDAQWLNPYTVKKEVDQVRTNDGVRIRMSYHQQLTGMINGPWGDDKITHFKLFDPRDELIGGISPVTVSSQSSRLLFYLREFAGRFFKYGAMPISLVSIDTHTTREQEKEIEATFKRAMTGIGKAYNVVAVPGALSVHPVTPELNTLALPEIRYQALSDVCHAFGIPETMMTDAANYATAVEHRQSFYEETINPQAKWIAEVITAQFLAPTGYKLEACPEQLSIFRVSEARRSSSLNQLVSAGMDPVTALEVLGYYLTDEQWQRVKESDKPVKERATNKPAGGGHTMKKS